MDRIINKDLYKKAKKEADLKYKRDGAYKSMFISKRYKELGGKYKGAKTNNLSKWRNEEWVSVEDYLKGKRIPCGSDKIGKNICRPLKGNVLTVDKVIKNLGKDKVMKIIKEKKKDMNKRINWRKGTVG